MISRSEFSGSRLRLARALQGFTQVELGERLGVSHQYVAFLEAGQKTPSELMLSALAHETGLAPGFFYGEPIPEFREEECHFRRRATTSVATRTRVLAHGTLFSLVVAYIDAALSLPADNVPTHRVQSRADIERAAEDCRKLWGLGLDTPIKNLTRAIERAGVIVTRLEVPSTKVDAFSRSGSRRIIVLNTEKDSPSRSRFDLAHELGHLVMHPGLVTGDPDTEAQADYFASALLMPRMGFAREFPRGTTRLNWDEMLRLKKRWGTSVAAIVRRAYDLRLVDPATYQRAYKHMASRGWLKGEPGEADTEEPEVVPTAFRQLARHFGATPLDVCKSLRWTPRTFEMITGIPVGDYEPSPEDTGVVQLDLIRAEHAVGVSRFSKKKRPK